MLSGETAAGKYPVEALKAMAMIAETTESDTNYESLCHHVGMDSTRLTISAAVSHAACTTLRISVLLPSLRHPRAVKLPVC